MPPARPGQGRLSTRELLDRYYHCLLDRLGPQGWWPARTRLEVIVGAILVQNTGWENARQALARLRKAGLLSLHRLRAASQAELEEHIRPAGFFRQKARTITGFLAWLDAAYQGSLGRLFSTPAAELRPELLELRGVGPETADAILLYAGSRPVFVADAYTRRVIVRHHLLPADADYASAQEFLHRHLPPDQALFNEFHALLVEVGKRYCKTRAPDCERCPLKEFLPAGQVVAA